jgi:hypothetical protein
MVRLEQNEKGWTISCFEVQEEYAFIALRLARSNRCTLKILLKKLKCFVQFFSFTNGYVVLT